jgi:membrane-bound lytic murein transglycosylase A
MRAVAACLIAAAAGCATTRGAAPAVPPPPPGPTRVERALAALPRLVGAVDRPPLDETGGPDDAAPLAAVLEAQAQAVAARNVVITIGERRIDAATYAAFLRDAAAAAARSPEALADFLARRATVVEYAAPDEPLLVTSYYEPIVDGALRPTARFSQPLYRAPDGLGPADPTLTRAAIDRRPGGALDGRGLELAWVDPIDAFVLHTEGSGVVRLVDDGGRLLALDFAASNHHPHVSIARALAHLRPPPKSMQEVVAHLRGLPAPDLRALLDKNPRYTFFRPRSDGARGPSTSLGAPAAGGRTIATDARYAPKGALGLLVTTGPRWDSGAVEPRFVPLRRFVVDSDTGGGIRGARVDYYWGRGEEAGRAAGVMRQSGRLFYFAPAGVAPTAVSRASRDGAGTERRLAE